MGAPNTTYLTKENLLIASYLSGRSFSPEVRIDLGLDVNELGYAFGVLQQRHRALRGCFSQLFVTLFEHDAALRSWHNANPRTVAPDQHFELLYTPQCMEWRKADSRTVNGEFKIYILTGPFKLLVLGRGYGGKRLVHVTEEIEDALGVLRQWVNEYGRKGYQDDESLKAARIDIVKKIASMFRESSRVRSNESLEDKAVADQLAKY